MQQPLGPGEVPYYLGLILGDAVVAFRVLRLMRVVRLLKHGGPGPGISVAEVVGSWLLQPLIRPNRRC